ncbi:succinate dehydrogenase assembly factor 2 [Palleronia sp. LCG004]|uniref:FAD assembly factor SdhE n=1 Tax=Palleronia sp. LCG004 TaxID=3079304 RepID=UPI002941E80C|nr:succinate dehydrogenase assembly factor 2 [Palleronia sp. LCG004]WOI57361.1 succinate dehydrogenase assembly factor 2 [Palleronia sp. LCG004]
MTDVEINTLKRLRLRSWRRGMKEMDLILGSYADAHLADLDAGTIELYEEMLTENDQELYRWVSGQAAPPPRFAPLVSEITAHMSDGLNKSRSS